MSAPPVAGGRWGAPKRRRRQQAVSSNTQPEPPKSVLAGARVARRQSPHIESATQEAPLPDRLFVLHKTQLTHGKRFPWTKRPLRYDARSQPKCALAVPTEEAVRAPS